MVLKVFMEGFSSLRRSGIWGNDAQWVFISDLFQEVVNADEPSFVVIEANLRCDAALDGVAMDVNCDNSVHAHEF